MGIGIYRETRLEDFDFDRLTFSFLACFDDDDKILGTRGGRYK